MRALLVLALAGAETGAPVAATLKNGTVSAIGQVAEALIQRDALVVLALGTVVAALVTTPTARWLRTPKQLALAALLAIAVIVALTVVPSGGFAELTEVKAPAPVAELALFRASEWRGALTGWRAGTDGPLNVLLFVPAGLLWGLVTRRAGYVLAGLAALSLAIELYQGVTGTRITNPADVVANTIGAGVGLALALALREVRRVIRT